MSAEAMCWAYEQTVGDPAAKFVLIMLADCAEGTEFSWPLAYVPGLSERTELAPDRLQRAMSILLERGYIRRGKVWGRVEDRPAGGWVEGVILNVIPAASEQATA